MCGRYFLPDEEDDIPKFRLILEELNRTEPKMRNAVHGGEIFPSEIAPVIVAALGGYSVRPMRWGFPRVGGGGLVINSRSEKADFTPMFQKAVRERRCLVPMLGFYEWKRSASGSKTKSKFAFSFGDATPGEMMYLAGVYGEFQGGFAEGGYDGFAILTQAADAQMDPYHDRVPVILRQEALKKLWLTAPPSVPFSELRRQFEFPWISASPVTLQ